MPSVYVLYTGGTMGSSGRPLTPMSGPAFARSVASVPGLASGRVAGYSGLRYTVDWTPRIRDSSSMTPRDWVAIARQLLRHYSRHAGFVVVHGTDTLAFTASALSFLLPGLSKPVVVTGSQLPLRSTLTDALANLVGAIVIAGTSGMPEVCVYFDSTILRGNRSTKVSAHRFGAFSSPNHPALGAVGTRIRLDSSAILPAPEPSVSLSDPRTLSALRERLAESARRVSRFSVASLVLYPGIQASGVRGMLKASVTPVRALVLEAFGGGNGPDDSEFLAVLSEARRDGVVVVDSTQVLSGGVDLSAYRNGSLLAEAGAVSGLDMTREASLTKLVCLFGFGLGADEVRARVETPICGELTPRQGRLALDGAGTLHVRGRGDTTAPPTRAASSDRAPRTRVDPAGAVSRRKAAMCAFGRSRRRRSGPRRFL